MEEIILNLSNEEKKEEILDFIERNIRKLTKKEKKRLKSYFLSDIDAELFFRFPKRNIKIIRTKSYLIIYYENTIKINSYFSDDKRFIEKALLIGIDESGKLFSQVFNGNDAKILAFCEKDESVFHFLRYENEAKDHDELLFNNSSYRIQGDLCLRASERNENTLIEDISFQSSLH